MIVHAAAGTSSKATLAAGIASVDGPFEPFAASDVSSMMPGLLTRSVDPSPHESSASTLRPASTMVPGETLHELALSRIELASVSQEHEDQDDHDQDQQDAAGRGDGLPLIAPELRPRLIA